MAEQKNYCLGDIITFTAYNNKVLYGYVESIDNIYVIVRFFIDNSRFAYSMHSPSIRNITRNNNG